MPPVAPLAVILATTLSGFSLQLGHELADEDYSRRAAAYQKLLKLEERALPPLHYVSTHHSDPEARARSRELAERLQTKQVRSRYSEATLVNLARPAQRVSQAFADLEAQTGYRFVVAPGNEEFRDRRIDLKIEQKRPFWEVLDELAEASGLEVAHTQPVSRRPVNINERPSYYSSSTPDYVPLSSADLEITPGNMPPLLLVPRTENPGKHISRKNVLRVRVESMSEDVRGLFDSGVIPLDVSVVAEPRLVWIKTHGVNQIRAKTADGRMLTPEMVPLQLPYNSSGTRADLMVQKSNGSIYEVQRDDEWERIWVPTDPVSTVVRLKSEYTTARITEFSGVITGVARTPPEVTSEIKLQLKQTDAQRGLANVEMKANLGPRDEEGIHMLEVTISFPVYRVMPMTGSDSDFRLAEIVARAGRPFRPRGGMASYYYRSDLPMVDGLAVKDADGQNMILSVYKVDNAFSLKDGESYIQRSYRLNVKAAKESQVPTRLVFMASLERLVEVPFEIKNVPALPGTAFKNR